MLKAGDSAWLTDQGEWYLSQDDLLADFIDDEGSVVYEVQVVKVFQTKTISHTELEEVAQPISKTKTKTKRKGR